MLKAYEYFRKMQDDNIILYFKGEITNNLLTSILQLIDDRLGRKNEDIKIKKKVFSILLECLQNVYNYQQNNNQDSTLLDSSTLIIKKKEDSYYILTGNYMDNTHIPELKKRLNRVNSLNSQELKELYKEVLNRPEPAKSGGAGLGLIDMARKSGEKIGFHFDQINNEHSFYSLQVKVSA